MTDAQLQMGVAASHRQKMRYDSAVVGGTVHDDEGILWTDNGPFLESTIAFPTLSAEAAGPALDRVVARYAVSRPSIVTCWSLDPTTPEDLAIRLLARGFVPADRPHWMAMELKKTLARGSWGTVSIDQDRGRLGNGVPDLPYASPDEGQTLSHRLAKRFPRQVIRLVANSDGYDISGHATVVFPEDDSKIAALYDVGVLARLQNHGLGTELVREAARLAMKRGCHWIVLNATRRRLYEKLGFRWIGDGLRWRLDGVALAAHPPTTAWIAVVEAVGRGDIAALDSSGFAGPDALGPPPAGGLDLLAIAVICGQPDAARWLTKHGVALDPLVAWEFGWLDDAADLLAADPDAIHRRYGPGNLTLLQIAIARGDDELGNLARAFGADDSVDANP